MSRRQAIVLGLLLVVWTTGLLLIGAATRP
jgi:hypothetical protein